MKYSLFLLSSTFLLVSGLMHSAQAQSIQLQLAPHQSQCIENHYPVSFDATCTISSKHHNKLRFHVLESSGAVNGKRLSKGQSTSVLVDNHGQIIVHAEPSSKVTVDNLSNDIIQANCSV